MRVARLDVRTARYTEIMRSPIIGWLLVLAAGCTPPPVAEPAPPINSGSSLLLRIPVLGGLTLRGAYDVELLDEVGGNACAEEGDRTRYWIGLNDLDQLAHDPVTKQAIAAAALDAIGRLDDADTILITRVVTDGKNAVRVCASVVGRAVRLTKAASTATPDTGSASGPSASEPVH